MDTNEVQDFLATVVRSRKQMGGPDWPYCCAEDFVLQEGREFEATPLPEDIQRGEMRRCFQNAHCLALSNVELSYTEGFAFQVAYPMLHAWCVTDDGKVVDPTWSDGQGYFGVPFDQKFACEFVHQQGRYGLIDVWELGFPLLSGELVGWQSKLFPKKNRTRAEEYRNYAG